MTDIPADVREWLHTSFAECNARISSKFFLAPNLPEGSFDMTWIEHFGHYSSPASLASGWTVKIETHYLGGMRHFGSWEIADIGVLLFLRLAEERVSKVALLQSKRLFPDRTPIREDSAVDYEIGLARLADPEDQHLSIGSDEEFSFSHESCYRALKRGSNQVAVIDDYLAGNGLAVYYQLYNPWSVPFTQRFPLKGPVPPSGPPELGVRVVPAGLLHGMLPDLTATSPCLGDLDDLALLPAYGWRLEEFVGDELLECREGNRFDSIEDDRIQRLFYRRTGPIAAAIAIWIEAPDAGALE